ncbi:MAG: tripartite tricarboxylate transporter permease [Methanimicrococcus sp.]|nr:tripartite tricarboxylate transporter permease [Methanimicrococcus sp.]
MLFEILLTALKNPVFGFIFCVFAGWIFGFFTGMIPGIHVNNIAVVLASTAGFLYQFGFSPLLLSFIILSCAVSHTFHNIIPAIFLGAPGEETVFAVLPGHKLLMAGFGFPTVRLSALSSAASVLISALLLPPAAFLLSKYYPFLEAHMGFILIGLSLVLLFSEKKILKILSATIVFLSAGFFGCLAFEMDGFLNPFLSFSSASVLMPILSGLFGVPPLILSLFSKSEFYENKKFEMPFSQKLFFLNAFLGTVAGAFVSWIPGISSSAAAVLASLFKNSDADSPDIELTQAKEYIVIVSAINTANAIFGLSAFFIIGKSRSGAVISIRDILSNASFFVEAGSFSGAQFELFLLFFAVILLCSFLSYFSTVQAGFFLPKILSWTDYRKISIFILLFLSGLIFLFCGLFGFIIFAAAVALGFLPIVFHVRKSNLMGVILFPVMLYFLGLRGF